SSMQPSRSSDRASQTSLSSVSGSEPAPRTSDPTTLDQFLSFGGEEARTLTRTEPGIARPAENASSGHEARTSTTDPTGGSERSTLDYGPVGSDKNPPAAA